MIYQIFIFILYNIQEENKMENEKKCPRNLTTEEIKLEFGNDDGYECNNCPNLLYSHGLILCGLISGDK